MYVERREEARGCALFSREVREPLHGTAPRVDVWVMVEYDAPWERDAVARARLPARLRAAVEELAARGAGARLQLIRRPPGSGPAGRRTVYVALTPSSGEERLFRFEFPDDAGLASFDPIDVASRPEAYVHLADGGPLYLVCTHGRYDRCCGSLGVPLLGEMSRRGRGAVWQTTHVGGHRFAPCVVCFPHGVYYGRLHPSRWEEVASAYERGELSLSHLRGRCTLPPEVQAAEYHLRRRTGVVDIEALRLEGRDELEGDRWRFVFGVGPGPPERYEVVLARRDGALWVVKGCGEEPAAVPSFELEHIGRIR